MSSASNPPTSLAPPAVYGTRQATTSPMSMTTSPYPASHKTTRHFLIQIAVPRPPAPSLATPFYVPGNLSHPGWLCQMAGGRPQCGCPVVPMWTRLPLPHPGGAQPKWQCPQKDSVLLGIYEQGGQVPLLSRQIHFPKNGIGHIVNVDTITRHCQWQAGSRRAELPAST